MLLILLAFAACTQQEWAEPSDEVTVTFSITPEQAFGTRATPDGDQEKEQVNRLVCAVYDIKGNLLKEFGDKDNENGQIVVDVVENFSANEGVSLPFRLVRGQEYKVAFWASHSDCEAYDTSDLSKVTIDYTKMPCNDSKYDAFCKTEAFTVSSNETKTVVLRRPFAQINVGISKSDYEALEESGKEITSSAITLGPVARILNVVDNSVSPATDNIITEVAFEKAPIPNGSFSVQMINDDGETTEEKYKYLALCYLLVADKNEGTSTYSSELGELQVKLYYGEESINFQLTDEGTKIPVSRNWSTNIFLTKDILNEVTKNK